MGGRYNKGMNDAKGVEDSRHRSTTMKWNVIEVANFEEQKIGTIDRKTERGVFLAWTAIADKRYTKGWRAVNPFNDGTMFGGHITEIGGEERGLMIRPA